METIDEFIEALNSKAKLEKERAFYDAVRWNRITEYGSYCRKLEAEYRQLAEWLKELQAHREAWEKCIKEIKDWHWYADKQAMVNPRVVDAMVDLFIKTIKECRPKEK